jgi:tRNA nucleotidyltransferase/poly(A) polymerase
MRLAISSGVLGMISRERVWRELFLAMDEEEAPIVLVALYAHGALTALLGDDIKAPGIADLDKVRQRVMADRDLDPHVLYTGVLLRGSEASPQQLEGSGFSQKRARAVLQIARDMSKFERALGDAANERQRFRLMKTATPEMLTLVAADRPDEERHIVRFQQFQKFKLPLRGNDLEVPGGPHVAKALERTREAVFTGEIAADQARSFARDMAIKYLNREPQPEQK